MKSIEFLTAAGARPDTVTAAGFFALGMSALKNHALACQLLLAKGASVDLHRGDGFTALFYAIDNGAADAAKALLRAGADCDASAEVEIGEDERDRLDPMQLAALRGSMEVAAMIYAFKESKVLRAKIAAPAKKASVRL